MPDKKAIITYWKKKKRTGTILPKENWKVSGGREDRYHSMPLRATECWLTVLWISVPSIMFWKCFRYLGKQQKRKQWNRRKEYYFSAPAWLESHASLGQDKKWMQCLKSRYKRVLKKKKKRKIWLWNEPLSEMEPAPQLVSCRMTFNTMMFRYKISCRVLLYDIVCMYLEENCLQQLSGQERKILCKITDIIKIVKM